MKYLKALLLISSVFILPSCAPVSKHYHYDFYHNRYEIENDSPIPTLEHQNQEKHTTTPNFARVANHKNIHTKHHPLLNHTEPSAVTNSDPSDSCNNSQSWFRKFFSRRKTRVKAPYQPQVQADINKTEPDSVSDVPVIEEPISNKGVHRPARQFTHPRSEEKICPDSSQPTAIRYLYDYHRSHYRPQKFFKASPTIIYEKITPQWVKVTTIRLQPLTQVLNLCAKGHEVDVTTLDIGSGARCPLDNSIFTVQEDYRGQN